ncbi:MAG: hypothetical protein F6J96_32060 [Symploca sp. SIO1C2]|nr:hypothetical protein [Symploca sp. SIO1C2]
MNQDKSNPSLVESTILSIWEKTLGIKITSLEQNFFKMGGNSISAVKIIAEINRKLHFKLDPLDLFKSPTIRSLARVAEKQLTPYPKMEIINNDAKIYATTPLQKSFFMLEHFKREGEFFHQPKIFWLEKSDDSLEILRAFEHVLKRHEILRTTFHAEDKDVVQKIHELSEMSGYFHFWKLDKGDNFAKESRKTYERLLKHKFDLNEGPLCRLEVLKSEKQCIAFLSIHHIISDGFSEDIIVKELLEYCNRQSQTQDNTLEYDLSRALKYQFKDYAHGLNNWLGSKEGKFSRDYWLTHLNNYQKSNFPGNIHSSATDSFLAHCIDFKLGKSLTEKINKLAANNNATQFMVLQALVKAFIYSYSGIKDIVVGSAFSVRPSDSEPPQIGPYLNTLPLRDQIDAEKTFIDFLSQVKETIIMAYAHRHIPISDLVSKNGAFVSKHLWNVGLTLQNQAECLPEYSGIFDNLLEERKFNDGLTTNIWLDVIIEDDQMVFQVFYRQALFEKSQIEDICHKLKAIITQLVNDPNTTLKSITSYETIKRKIDIQLNF